MNATFVGLEPGCAPRVRLIRDIHGLHAEVFDASEVVRGVTFSTAPEVVQDIYVQVYRQQGLVFFALSSPEGMEMERRYVSFLEGA